MLTKIIYHEKYYVFYGTKNSEKSVIALIFENLLCLA